MSGHGAMGTGWSSSVGRLLTGVGGGVLAQQVPPGLIDEVLEATGRSQRRFRALPSRLGIYFVFGLCLFSDLSYGSVIATLVTGCRNRLEAVGWRPPSSTALTTMRRRLGAAPFELLFRRLSGSWPSVSTAGSHAFGLLLVAWDGTSLDLADSDANAEAFGRPSCKKGDAGYPQSRAVVLMACGSHRIIDAVFGIYRSSERALAERLLPTLKAGMLLLADRVPQLPPVVRGAGHRRRPAVAGRGRPTPARPTGAARWLLPDTADRPCRLSPPGQQASPPPQGRPSATCFSPAPRPHRPRGRGGDHRAHRRRHRTDGPLPADHHAARPAARARTRTGRHLRPKVGGGNGVPGDQDLPAGLAPRPPGHGPRGRPSGAVGLLDRLPGNPPDHLPGSPPRGKPRALEDHVHCGPRRRPALDHYHTRGHRGALRTALPGPVPVPGHQARHLPDLPAHGQEAAVPLPLPAGIQRSRLAKRHLPPHHHHTGTRTSTPRSSPSPKLASGDKDPRSERSRPVNSPFHHRAHCTDASGTANRARLARTSTAGISGGTSMSVRGTRAAASRTNNPITSFREVPLRTCRLDDPAYRMTDILCH